MRLTQTHFWAAAGLAARIAPVSIVPLLLHLYDPAQVDWFVIVQTNAMLIAVIVGFSQANFIQQNYSENNRSSLIFLTSIVPPVLAAALSSIAYVLQYNFYTFLYSLILGVSMSYVPQAQAILKCSGQYYTSIAADLLRILLFAAFGLSLLEIPAIPIKATVFMMALYYIIPHLLFCATLVRKLELENIPSIWRASVAYLSTVTFSVLLSAATLSLLRYILLHYGNDGDLAAYAAIYSIASLSVVTVDFIYVRVSQDIVVGARERNDPAIMATARKIVLPVCAISVFSLVVTSGYVATQVSRPDNDALIAAAMIVVSFTLRSIYVFFQNILIGLKNARFDFLASGLALGITAATGPFLVNWWPLVGAAAMFLLICLTYVITLGSVVRHLRNNS